jgi:hypothetical protein
MASGLTPLRRQISISEARDPRFGAFIAACEQAILAIQCDWAHCSLDCVGIHLDAAIVEEPRKTLPMVETVADRLGRQTLAREDFQALLEPAFEHRHERLHVCLPALPAFFRRPPMQGARWRKAERYGSRPLSP